MASRMRTGLLLRGGLERRLDLLPVLRVHAAVHGQQPVAAGEPLRRPGLPCSQFCVARYSVKMMTRSSDHLPAGPDVRVQPAIRPFALESSWADARLRPRPSSA